MHCFRDGRHSIEHAALQGVVLESGIWRLSRPFSGAMGLSGFCISIRGRVASCSLQELVSECMRGFCDVEGPGCSWGFKLLGFRDVWSLQFFICIYIYIFVYIYIYIHMICICICICICTCTCTCTCTCICICTCIYIYIFFICIYIMCVCIYIYIYIYIFVYFGFTTPAET